MVTNMTNLEPPSDKYCPTCGSLFPNMHPATSEGGEVVICKDKFHSSDPTTLKAIQQLYDENYSD
jgi:hypothetical protein